MKLTIAGCGDAFGSGGRLNTCFHVAAGETSFLIDCGATSMVALRRAGIDPNQIDAIYISHLHGDHFAGLPFFLIDALYVSRRKQPLKLVGPAALEARFHILAEAMFPLITEVRREFALEFIALEAGVETQLDRVAVMPFTMRHFSGAPSFALRFMLEDKVLAFTGDTGWTDEVITAGRGADLYIMECFTYDLTLDMHLNYMMIASHYGNIDAKRILLSHMGSTMLDAVGHVDQSRFTLAEDGQVIEI